MKSQRFSPERLAHIRRLRKARRLFKKVPLFSYQQMLTEYPAYSYDEFCDDLHLRRKPKRKPKKSNAIRYGRFARITMLLRSYQDSGNINMLIEANKLHRRLRKPYLVEVLHGNEIFGFSLPAQLPLDKVERLVQKLRQCKSSREIRSTYQEFKNSTSII